MSVTKLKQEDILKIKEIQIKLSKLFLEIGKNKINMEVLKEEEKILLKNYDDIKIEEKNIVEYIIKKYGDGQLNLETGELIK